jgi:hypothetical protein
MEQGWRRVRLGIEKSSVNCPVRQPTTQPTSAPVDHAARAPCGYVIPFGSRMGAKTRQFF